MTPEMWLELEPIPHRCNVQLAAVRQFPQGMHGVALLLHCSRSTLRVGCLLSSCGLGATVGWVGAPIFFSKKSPRGGASFGMTAQ